MCVSTPPCRPQGSAITQALQQAREQMLALDQVAAASASNTATAGGSMRSSNAGVGSAVALPGPGSQQQQPPK